MYIVVQFTEHEERQALPLLLRHSPGVSLPVRTYVITTSAAGALTAAGITFQVLSNPASQDHVELLKRRPTLDERIL
jgi:hypothetical protein